MEKEYQMYEGKTMQKAMDKLLADGAKPAFKTIKEAWKYKQKHSPNKWIGLPFYFCRGEIKRLTLKQCKNLQKIYDDEGRVLWLDGSSSGLYGSNDLDLSGRWFGVKNVRNKKRMEENKHE